MTKKSVAFDELATKDDLKKLEEKLPTRKTIEDLKTSVDNLALAVAKMTDEHIILRNDVKKVKQHVGLDI